MPKNKKTPLKKPWEENGTGSTIGIEILAKLKILKISPQNINSCFVARLLRRVALVLRSEATSQSSIYLI
jgi:hypothetical protein